MAETVGSGEGDQVHVEVSESLRRNLKFADWRSDMSGYLGLLARYAFACPPSRVRFHGWPDESVRDCLLSAMYTWVPQAMNRVEDATAP